MNDKTDKVTQELPLTDKYTVSFKGKPVLQLNPKLVKQQNISDEQLEEIKRLHQVRLQTEEYMKNFDVLSELRAYAEAWTELQYQLQEAWGFERNSNYHKFWTVPRCECPTLDNEDAYPTGYYVINQSCPVHGEIV